jgi:cellulose synthase/poly-beta-1,6-N-acetylglucosamine synthase-like glycosyltransferase
VLILVPCRDDAGALRAALPSLRAAVRPGRDRLVVVADRCRDDTAAAARQGGAEAIERRDESAGAGKAGALLFALRRDGAASSSAPVVIFDADSRPSADFCARVEDAFGAGRRAVQAEVVPLPGRGLLSRLAAYSEILSQRVAGRVRTALGWTIPLRGTGMAVSGDLLARALERCATQVEDLEITLLLAAAGVRIEPLNATVEDPKPGAAAGLAAQRARWLAGNVAALVARRREIARLLRSLDGATLVAGLFARPRSLFFSGRLLLLGASLAWGNGPAWAALAAVLAVFVGRDLALFLAGLLVVDRPLFYLPAIAAAPLYPLLWAASALRAFGARKSWLSARRPS